MRLVFRLLGFMSLASGFLAGVVDGTRSIAAGVIDMTALGEAVNWLSPKAFALLEEAVPRLLHPLLWDPVLTTFFQLPAMITLFALGLLLLWLGQGGSRPQQ